jgi:hypothetical protein
VRTEDVWRKRRTDVAVLVVGDDYIRKALVHGGVLFPGGRLVEGLRFRRIWDGVVQCRPQHLVTELVVTLGELSVRDLQIESEPADQHSLLPQRLDGKSDTDPNRKRIALFLHPPIDVPAHVVRNGVRVCAEGANPQLLPQFVVDTINGIAQASVRMGVWLQMPSLT